MTVPPPPAACLLAVNAGSSSIKYALYQATVDAPRRLAGGVVDRFGPPDDARLGAARERAVADIAGAVEACGAQGGLRGIGHRIVHGGLKPLDHQRITADLVRELRAARPFDLTHLPTEIALIEALGERFPGVPQVACFDSAFHRDLPGPARLLPLPRRYHDLGFRRLGFHGLSFAYLMEKLGREDPAAARGRVILAHLGSGASLAAVRDGHPMDTSMGFTPTAGLVMATRPGDLDPGLLAQLVRRDRLDAETLDDLVSRRSGLLGISGTTGDMAELLARRDTDRRAAEAVELFCYQARKWVGAFAAVLGGLDALVFSGGIGQHAPAIRAEIAAGLEFLGLQLDPKRNAAAAPVISARDSRVTVRVIATDEEGMIARLVMRVLALDPPR